jgi:hypothetical protein
MKTLSLRTAAADGTQFCGPNYDGTGAERIAKDWPANGF